MTFALVVSMLTCAQSATAVELLIVGDGSKPITFVVEPISYHGDKLSPAVIIEDALIQALSSTGLFNMPYTYEAPNDHNNMLAWQLAGIRFVIQGSVHEVDQQLRLQLNIYDTLGLQPTYSSALLNPDQLALSAQVFADQVYRSLFYATFTNETEKQYLQNENRLLTRYLNHLVLTFKNSWHSQVTSGSCQVDLQQLPGGVIFKHRLDESCFANADLGAEVEALLARLDVLPYENYQDVFSKNLQLEFIAQK